MYKDELLRLSRNIQFRNQEAQSNLLSDRRNPACGDELALYGNLENGKVESLTFYAQGCAVCIASCTALCQELNGCINQTAKTRIQEALSFFDGEDDWHQDWGSPALPALGAVRARPMRMKCVRLAWEALRDVL